MVEITNITNQKNKNKFNLFVDGEFYAGINKETAITNNFFVGKKLDKQELDDILVQSESKQAFAKASDYLQTRLYSKFEIRTKLTAKGFSKPAIRLAINKLEDYGYVNDSEFAAAFVSSNAKLSKKMLENKLAAKGISKDIIKSALDSISSEDQYQTCLACAQKYIKNKKVDEVREKLYAHLARKGFEYSQIKSAIKQIYNIDLDFGE